MDSIQSLPLWVRFPELDIRYWGCKSVSKLGSIIGIPIKTDRYTKEKEFLSYARMMIEVPVTRPFPDTIEFINDQGVLVRQKVIFEWKPTKCSHCHLFGHEVSECRKKQGIRKEWRVVQKPLPETQEP